MTEPSAQWTPEERLKLLHDLAIVSWHEPDVEARDRARMCVLCVTDDSTRDLELNRDVILKHARRADEVMQGLAASRQKPEQPAGPNMDVWKVVKSDTLPPEYSVDFTDLFFQYAVGFERAAKPVFEPKPGLHFTAKSFYCWLDVEADEHELDSARVLAMASVFAPAIAKQLNDRGQHFVHSVRILRPVTYGQGNEHYASRSYQLYARATRGLKPEELAAP